MIAYAVYWRRDHWKIRPVCVSSLDEGPGPVALRAKCFATPAAAQQFIAEKEARKQPAAVVDPTSITVDALPAAGG
jgi:hypothetical protein